MQQQVAGTPLAAEMADGFAVISFLRFNGYTFTDISDLGGIADYDFSGEAYRMIDRLEPLAGRRPRQNRRIRVSQLPPTPPPTTPPAPVHGAGSCAQPE